MVLFDEAVDYLAMRGQGSDGRLFVVTHEAAVAVDVGAEDSGELAFHSHPETAANHPAGRQLSVKHAHFWAARHA